MDWNFRKFISLIMVLMVFCLIILSAFGFFYKYSTINTYKFVLLILILLTIILSVFYIISALTIVYIYKKKKANRTLLKIAGMGANVIFPLLFLLSNILKVDKDILRKFYIDFNNTVVRVNTKKYKAEKVLVLLPHCLQNYDCKHKITNSINNCKRCGKCTIGDIARVVEERKVRVEIVTGGTAARNIIYKTKPDIIIAVACERDLTSGIMDVGKIKVVGLINERPNGPCFNTRVDMNKLTCLLDDILE